MYDKTITIFNYREDSHNWRTAVFTGVDVIEHTGRSATQHGNSNEDNVEILLHATSAQVASATDVNGEIVELQYLTPKVYAVAEDVSGYFTMTPESDFIMVGNHGESMPLNDDEYEEGLYHAMNALHDGVYMITGTTWYTLMPHFEIGGR